MTAHKLSAFWRWPILARAAARWLSHGVWVPKQPPKTVCACQRPFDLASVLDWMMRAQAAFLAQAKPFAALRLLAHLLAMRRP
ncbi:MAG: hypothetical protein AAF281_05295 [Pseudomonadota bacterium]